MQHLGDLGCSLGCTFSHHCKERWGSCAAALTWIPTPREWMAAAPKATLPRPETASHSLLSKGKTNMCPRPASPAHLWGREASASGPSALDPSTKLSREMETFVNMLQERGCTIRKDRTPGQFSPWGSCPQPLGMTGYEWSHWEDWG